jgi:hypothetical protein
MLPSTVPTSSDHDDWHELGLRRLGGTAFDLVNIAGGRVCFVRHNRDPRPMDSHPMLRASLGNGLNPNYCFQSANIRRESCVCLGVSDVRNDE